MAGMINWKQKYLELKSKYMNAVDMAFRLGYEQGSTDSSMEAQSMANATPAPQSPSNPEPTSKPNNNDAPGTPDQGNAPDKSGAPSVQPTSSPDGQPDSSEPISENPEGSELDQHIAKLESLVAKSESLNLEELNKTINDLKNLQKSVKPHSHVSRALHTPEFKLSLQAQHNLDNNSKATLTMQHKIVQEALNKWEEEEKRANKNILDSLKIEGIIGE